MRAAGRLDARPGERLGRERQRLGAHQVEPGALGVGAVEQVEHHLGTEPGRPDAQAGVAQGVRRATAVRRTEEGAEAGTGVDRAAPAMAEPQPLELGKGLEELPGEQLEGRRALVVGRPDVATEVVDRVVAAPQDPVVGGHPVVVELVGHVVEALSTRPADGGELVGAERLGHQHVVVDRHGVEPEPPHWGGEGVGAERDVTRVDDGTGPRVNVEPGPAPRNARDGGLLVDPDAQ